MGDIGNHANFGFQTRGETDMKASINWVGKACLQATSDSGHTITLDGPPESGGENKGIRPMEMLLLGMGGCTTLDVVYILKKARQDISGCDVELDAERADKPPKVFTRIHVHFRVAGRGLDPKQVERAINLSAEKYCSASIMLGKTAEISHDFEIIEA